MKRISYRIANFILIAALLLSGAVTAHAASTTEASEKVQLRSDCTLDVTYSSEGMVFAGQDIKLWHIADITEDAQYALAGSFRSYPIQVTGTSSQSEWEDTVTLCEMAQEEDDASLLPEVTAGYDNLEKEISERRLAALLSGEYDANNAILTFHAGAGGTEAQDWTEMLYRMYTRWAERHGYTYQLMDYEAGDEAGIKSATILIEGDNAYGYLKSENGVHRLVRVSPFDANARRQTSFAAVEVMPELDDDSEIEIRPEDIEMQACRSSGAGGQHINKTSSAVRLTHLPTGIVVFCQTERSQFQNRDNAMKMLRAKLAELKMQQHAEKVSDLKGVQMKIEWGSQIRSYVFMPYTLAKDTRTGYEMGNIQAVMDGDIDGFINAYLTAAANGEIKK